MTAKKARTLALLLSVLAVLLAWSLTSTARAEVSAGGDFKAWDPNRQSFENRDVAVLWDGSSVVVYAPLDFDAGPYTPRAEDRSSCAPGAATSWAGRIELALDHVDSNPAGAPGFTRTQGWGLVDCDLIGSGAFRQAYQAHGTPGRYPESIPAAFEVIEADRTAECAAETCLQEIVTTIFVNLDMDCDGNPDAGLPENVCFVATAATPTHTGSTPFWSGPAQARLSLGGETQTVTFNPFGPTAITLETLSARTDFSALMIFGGVLLVVGACLIIVAAWRNQQEAPIN